LNLSEVCKSIRRDIIFQIGTFGIGHIGGSLSVVEMLVVLYKNHMKIDISNPKKSGRDRLIVSKGHAGPAVYSVLSHMGFFDKKWLSTLNQPGTNLPSHCDMKKTPGIDMTTGSLGQGLSCAVGAAIGSKIKSDNAKIYSILGDGELQEGQIWEAAMFSSHQKLDNLIALIDYNRAQIDGTTDEICSVEPLIDKWLAFGWDVLNVKNGNSCSEIDIAINEAKNKSNPCAIIARTIKGFGVSFAEKAGTNNHSMKVSENLMKEAFKELEP